MKNNRRVKLIAWIMTAMMLLSIIPVAALANEPATDTFSLSTIKTGKYILNDSATCDVFYSKDNQTFDDLSNAVLNQDYVMEIDVSAKENMPIPDTTMYYELPTEVYSAVAGSNSVVSWKTEGKYLVFNWANGVKESFFANVTVKACKEYDLYNIAKIDNTYYRLAKTKITMLKSLNDYIAGKKDGVDNVVPDSEYKAEEYNFGNITKDKIEYVYRPNDYEPSANETINYYKATLLYVTAVKKKIGGMNGNNPRWINGVKYYDDPNTTDSFHRNYELKFYTHVGLEDLDEYPLMNILKYVDNNKKEYFYRLKFGTILAKDPDTKPYAYASKVNESEFTVNEEYDFSNVVLHIDGIDYVYSDHILEGQHRSYFTVKYDRVTLQSRVNGDDAWYRNPMGFLDGSQIEYQGVANQTVAYHRDYVATLHPGNLPNYGVTISSSLAGKAEVLEGTMITLTGTPIGFDNTPYSIRWERKDPATGNVEVIEGQNSLTYTFPITEETSKYDYYIVLTPLE